MQHGACSLSLACQLKLTTDYIRRGVILIAIEMGAGSSVRAKGKAEPVHSGNVKSSVVRQRLRDEFGEDCEDGSQNQESETTLPVQGSSSVKLSELPGVFKAKEKFLKPVKERRQITKDTNILKKPDNPALVKELYRRMDPSVTTTSQRVVTGEIQLSMKYRDDIGSLLVRIGAARDLKIEHAHKVPDPYVAVYLLTPDGRANLVKKTKQKWNTSKPVFQEILAFSLPNTILLGSKVKLSVRSRDKISEDDFLGEVVLELCKVDLSSGVFDWYELHPETDLSICGSIDISAKHTIPHTFSITIHEGKSLKAADPERNTSHPYVRCLIKGIETRYSTEVKESTKDPVFDETYEFKLHREELEFRLLVLNVFSKDKSKRKDKRLGDVHIPLSELQDGVLARKTYTLKDLRNAPHTVQPWTDEGIAAEFKEAMRAHILYQFPNFLFKGDPKGKKTISVSSSKARTNAKVLINNGFPNR